MYSSVMSGKKLRPHFVELNLEPSVMRRYLCKHCQDVTKLVTKRLEQMRNHLKRCTDEQHLLEGLPILDEADLLSGKRNPKSVSEMSKLMTRKLRRICRGALLDSADERILKTNITDDTVFFDIARELLPLGAKRRHRYQSNLVKAIALKNLPLSLVSDLWSRQAQITGNPFLAYAFPSFENCKKI